MCGARRCAVVAFVGVVAFAVGCGGGDEQAADVTAGDLGPLPTAEDTLARCQDGYDNDGDGATDCADPDCQVFVVCLDVMGPDTTVDTGGDAPVADVPSTTRDTGAPCEPCGNGSLRGLVCAPSEQIFVSQAHVTIEVVDCDGQPQTLEAWSRPDGTYYFPEVPCGSHIVQVDKGSFHVQYTVTIQPGRETDVSGADYKLCFGAGDVRIAVFWGQWDEMQYILDRLGFVYEWFYFRDELYMDPSPWDDVEAVQLLLDPQALQRYDIIFLNCGSAYMEWAERYPSMAGNLRDWVMSGGSLYATDLAWVLVERAWPDAVDFYGDEDATPADTQIIEPQSDHTATIVDEDLVAYLGGITEREVHYGAGPLISIAEAGAGTDVHVTAYIDQRDRWDLPIWDPDYGSCGCVQLQEDQPVVLSFQPSIGAGRVIYTTFHNDEQADQDTYDEILHYLVFLL